MHLTSDLSLPAQDQHKSAAGIAFSYENRWRDLGIALAFVVFNFSVVLLATWFVFEGMKLPLRRQRVYSVEQTTDAPANEPSSCHFPPPAELQIATGESLAKQVSWALMLETGGGEVGRE